MSKVIGLFPTPFMKVDGFLTTELQNAFRERAAGLPREANSATDLLSHSRSIDPAQDPVCAALVTAVTPHLTRFGSLLFAEELAWSVKEIWLNVLERGGSQFMHSHANSFVSGVVYVNAPHASARTMFRRNAGGNEFVFRNDLPAGHFSSDTWVVPEIAAGDLVLYPSYLLHGVPPNEGDQRITVAFNAIPDRLESLGYRIRFAT
jgi:uncharacterized protein (TIGR02466 family)